VAVGADQDMLVNQVRIPLDEREDRVGIIPPDCLGELHGMRKPRPARGLVTSGEHELRVGQLR
jgi:hypothetical protein